MPLNLDIIGKKADPIPFICTPEKVILYALGIGAGVGELDFVYEKNLKVFPTFAAIPPNQPYLNLKVDAGLNMPTVLHSAEKILLDRQIPTSGTIYTSASCISIYDKKDRGALINIETETKDENGLLLSETHIVIIDRSAGNFGGSGGPKLERLDAPEGKDPDFHVDYATSPNQSLLYRLKGDTHPLHVDPEYTKLAVFSRPILHGLCTFGFAGRGIIQSLCESDPTRFKSFGARFMGPVFPGDTLITEGWQVDKSTYIIRTKTQDGRVVLGDGLTEVTS